MSARTTVVFVHGDGGPKERHWLDALDGRLRKLGMPALAQEADVDVVDVRYDDALIGLDDEPPVPRLVSKADRDDAARGAFDVRRADMSTWLARFDRPSSERALPFPDSARLQQVAKLGFDDVTAFTESSAARRRALRAVLGEIPTEGRVILIGHSLGSVVALACLTRLPEQVDVPLFLTIGSPLPLAMFAKPMRTESKDHFPYRRVGSWVNVYGTRDPIPMSRGMAAVYPQAIDHRIDIGYEHAAAAYVDTPVVATLIAGAAFPKESSSELARVGSEELVPVTDPNLTPILLRFQWLHAWADWASKDKQPELNARIQRAIHLLAADLEEQRHTIEDDWGQPLPQLPNLRREAALSFINLEVPDRLLLAQLVYLSQTRVETPFKAGDHKSESLSACRRTTWEAVRPGPAGRRDAEKADEVIIEAIVAAESCFSRANYWPWVAAGGLTLLALTGVGLVVAAPAGLAGAAAISATLAAFGPGGMVGGVATVATLTGTGTAATAGGVARGMSKEDRRDLREAGKSMALAQVLSQSPEGLRGALISMMATALACRYFFLEDAGSETWDSLVLMEEACARAASHVRGADDGSKHSPLNQWNEKRQDCQKALVWMTKHDLGPQDPFYRQLPG